MFTPRITWPDLPTAVRDEVERSMGATVVEWKGQHGGFSPGTADRLVFDHGRRAFCKAVSRGLNEGALGLCQRELEVNRHLPSTLPVPAMLHGVQIEVAGDDELGTEPDTWVLMLFDDLEGRHPHTPWQADELSAALDSLTQVARLVPQAWPELPTVTDLLGPDLQQWPDIAAEPPASLDAGLGEWVFANLDELMVRSDRAVASLAGEALCQLDARADNMVLDEAGKVWLVDWPWASRGAPWLDAALFGMTVTQTGLSSDLEELIDEAVVRNGGTADQVTDLWAGMLGYYVWVSALPAPTNLPTIRAFQSSARDSLAVALGSRMNA